MTDKLRRLVGKLDLFLFSGCIFIFRMYKPNFNGRRAQETSRKIEEKFLTPQWVFDTNLFLHLKLSFWVLEAIKDHFHPRQSFWPQEFSKTNHTPHLIPVSTCPDFHSDLAGSQSISQTPPRQFSRQYTHQTLFTYALIPFQTPLHFSWTQTQKEKK